MNRPDRPAQLESARRTWGRNLAALHLRDPALARTLEQLPFANLPTLQPARSAGEFTLQLTADDGKTLYAHSRYRPREEARRFVADLQAPEHPNFVLAGLGLGYVAEAIEERFDTPLLVILEDDLPLLKTALCLHDLSGPLRAGRLILIWNTDRTTLNEKLMRANADVLLGLHFVHPPLGRRFHVQFQETMRAALADFAATARTQMVTLLRTSRVTVQNVAYNLAAYLDQPGVESLAGRGKGRPAIVVAAGPSLARHLDLLRELQDKAVIICVQTVLRLLRTLGIRPHFVTCLDYHEISATFYEGIDDVDRCRLVAEPKATWHVLDNYPGETFVLHHRNYETLLGDSVPRHGELRPGTTVAHLAFYVAEHLGCDPIILIGQDLAYSDGLFYLPGSPVEAIWSPEMNRFQTIEMKQWDRIVRNRPILRATRDVNDRPIYTDDLLFTYAEQFVGDFGNCPARVIQATEGGLRLDHTTPMTLADAAAAFCRTPLPADLLTVPNPPLSADRRAAAARALRTRIAELDALHEIASEMRDLLARLADLLDRPDAFNRALVRVDELRTLIRKYDAMYRLVVDVSSSAELRRHSADRQLGTVQRETSATARQRLKRDREFVAEFVAGCAFLREVLPEALRRLEERSR